MDPTQAFTDLSRAVEDANWDRATEIAQDLTHWLTNGGFPPDITGIPVFDKIVARATCDAINAWEVV